MGDHGEDSQPPRQRGEAAAAALHLVGANGPWPVPGCRGRVCGSPTAKGRRGRRERSVGEPMSRTEWVLTGAGLLGCLVAALGYYGLFRDWLLGAGLLVAGVATIWLT